ncbi:hypothetical protein AWC38_SpisGene23451 [Stylophora pistillata]|uniref:ALK tyrosine kinase receptor n=1 Tax=Stylophora pistillata TaxID=50429 RepID=A0A2B4R870_STYPI|nr:hypothetical protein AWC38_SpisGene23451 [Stylophora pistillata]
MTTNSHTRTVQIAKSQQISEDLSKGFYPVDHSKLQLELKHLGHCGYATSRGIQLNPKKCKGMVVNFLENQAMVPDTLKILAFKAVFTNLIGSGRIGPTRLGSHYTGQDHDGQVTLSSGVQQWTVPYTGDYRIKAIAAAGGYDQRTNSARYRGRGAKMIGTFRLKKGEVIQILVGQEGGIKTKQYSSGGGGGTFVVRGANTPLIIAGGGGGVDRAWSRHKGCDARKNRAGNPGYKSWSGGSNGHGAHTADDGLSGKGIS